MTSAVGLVTSTPRVRALLAIVLCLVVWPFEPAAAAGSSADVDAARVGNADREPGNWMTYGRTYSEQRFSPLSQITADNAKQLGLAWYADLDTNRGQEATPLEIDGVLYVSTAWSMVKAYDAKTGKLLWSYDPARTARARCKRLLRRGQSRSCRLARKDLRGSL